MLGVPLSRLMVFVLLAVGGCAIDLWTKGWIFAKLGMPNPNDAGKHIVLVPGIFSLTTSLNEGALFGLGQGMTFLFAGLSVLAALGIVYWLFLAGAGRDWWLTVALGAIMAGVFGNLYDRLGLPGLLWNAPDARAGQPVFAVRDWLHFEIRAIGFDWPIFNIADSFLVAGAGMLLFHAIWREGKIAKQSANATETNVSGGKPSASA